MNIGASKWSALPFLILIFSAVTVLPGGPHAHRVSTPSEHELIADEVLPAGLQDALRDALVAQGNIALPGSSQPTPHDAKLVANDAEPHDRFGNKVAISGNTVLVGAPFEDPDVGGGPVSSAGSAYVFVRSGSTWTQQAKLEAADLETDDRFGDSVAISGDTAVVGAFLEDPDRGAGPLGEAGSAYIFVRSGTLWTQQAKLVASDAEAGDFFGRSVSISGDTAVVGAYLESPDLGGGPLGAAGSAYVFVRSGGVWSEQAKLSASDAEANDRFGTSVAISGETIIVGAYNKALDVGGGPLAASGAAYVFVRSGSLWSQQARLSATDVESGDRFGASVAIAGETAVVGAWTKTLEPGGEPIFSAGSAYVFARSGSTWNQQSKLLAADAEAGDGFGYSVAIAGEKALVGAWMESPDLGSGPIAEAGSAYLYNLCGSTWSQQTKLVAGDADMGDEFGWAVALSGDTALAGAQFADPDPGGGPLEAAGAAYVFEVLVEAGQTFDDVEEDHWAWQFIDAIACAGLTAGYPDGTYRPDNPVTRAEMAVFLKKGIHGSTYTPPAPDASHPFNDIAGHWAEAWIEELYDEGMTSGYPDGTYRPENQVTRAEMAIFLLKAMHGTAYTPPAPAGGSFTDVSGHWAEAWIEQLKEDGITSGYPDGSYRPENQVTRAEMAVFLVNAFSLPLP